MLVQNAQCGAQGSSGQRQSQPGKFPSSGTKRSKYLAAQISCGATSNVLTRASRLDRVFEP